MRGASALQKALSEHPDAAVRVLIVWEPVLATDVGPPLPWVLSEITDRRAFQFWDRRRALSEELRQAAETHPSGSLNTASQEIGSTFWDYIAFFPPGAQWDSPAPNPTGWYFPVAHHMDEVRANLAAMGIERQSSGSP